MRRDEAVLTGAAGGAFWLSQAASSSRRAPRPISASSTPAAFSDAPPADLPPRRHRAVFLKGRPIWSEGKKSEIRSARPDAATSAAVSGIAN